MSYKFWRELTEQSRLEEMCEIFRKDEYATDKEVAIRLARFAEAHVFNTANREIIESENGLKLYWIRRFWTWLTRKRDK